MQNHGSRILSFSLFVNLILFGAPRLSVPETLTIGRNLETFASVRLSEHAPAAGLTVRITSNDPKKVLFSDAPDKPGQPSITLTVKAQYVETPDFFLQAGSELGTATYSVAAEGYEQASGKAIIGPSGIMLHGPYKAPTFKTTTGAPARITVYSALVDKDGKVITPQPVAGGRSVEIEVRSSDEKVAKLSPSRILIQSGMMSAETQFQPALPGTTTLSLAVPQSFGLTAAAATVAATVDYPGIGLTGDLTIGKDLQTQGIVLLGEPPPAGGLDIELKSSDPKKLLLSTNFDKVGSGSLTVHVPEGQLRASYFIQSLSDSGTVNYTATAKGFRQRAAPVYLAPSGFMVVYWLYGPPDEAEVLRANSGIRDPRPFTASISAKKPAYVSLWPVYLNPETKRGADRTAQRLRAGVSAVVELKNSNPDVAQVTSKVVLKEASEFALAEFKPLAPGQTVISVNTPAGFSAPSNGSTVTAIVKD